ncbi:MAG: stealth family protein [Flavobacterium sp.]|uniref:stealth family protein n=1 Tax=Flavobacterium sp. TaxID=239 RepID=UPI003265C15B
MKHHSGNNFEIDAVIAWVDGNDENHINKLNQYVENKSSLNQKGFLTRFNEVNEIEYCIKSIKKFAPYVKNIYIVTDNQTPDFIKNNAENPEFKNIKIVDHKEIFKGYENYLPLFNSYSIETMITRIPNLAEHFIYFNDDMFLVRETKATDFFTDEGFPIIRGQWSRFESTKFKEFLISTGLKKNRVSRLGYKKGQENSARILGLEKYFRLNHTPSPIRKSILNDYFDTNPEVVINNIKHRFRVPTYFMFQSHSAHLEVLNKSFEQKKSYKLIHFGSTDKPLSWIKFKLSLQKKYHKSLFLNIQSLDLYPKKKLDYILNWLDKLLE